LALKPSATAEYKLTAVGGDGTETSETVRVVVQDAPAAIGMLLVQTQLDGVAVLINGRRHGRLTESGEVRIPLDAKEYVIGVEKTGFESPEARRVRLAKDTTQRLQFRLQPKPAVLAITGAPAGVQVALDGKPLGVLQGDGQFQVPPGTHVIEFSKDRQPFRRLSLQFEPGSQLNLTRQDIGAPETPKPAPPPPEPAPDPKVIEARQWEQIRNAADPAVLEQFVRDHPNGQYAGAARQRMEQLEWDAVRSTRNPSALQAFANRYPSGAHRDEALRLIEQIEWERLNRSDEDSVRAYLKRFPNSQQARTELARLEQVQREKADAQAVVNALNQFTKAYESKDSEQVARIWPSIPKPTMDTIRRVFSEARSITMRIQPVDVQITGDTAVVKGQRTSVTVYPRRKPTETDSIVIQLRRSGSGWVIQSIH
jgi:hypothetical protein